MFKLHSRNSQDLLLQNNEATKANHMHCYAHINVYTAIHILTYIFSIQFPTSTAKIQ